MVAITLVTSFVLAASHLVSCFAVAPGQIRDSCTVKTQRKAWQNLTATEKSSYIKSTQCLINSPSKSGFAITKTRWDDLQYIHVLNTPFVHGTGAFLPFHRYFISVHESILRDECGYNGAMPYWTEPLDVENFTKSPLFDPVTGFGGNGTGSDHCVQDGPFANLTLRIKADLTDFDYCLSRNFNPCLFRAAAQKNVDACMAMPTFETLRNCIEGQPHSAGHGGINALMQDVNLSPGDPIFYLHHTYLDKLWWDWQSQDLTKRLVDISGNNMPFGFGFGFGGGAFPGANGTGFPGANGTGFPGVNVTGFPPLPFGAPGNASAFPPFDPECFKGFPNPFAGMNRTNGSMPGMPMMMKPNKAISDYFNDGGMVTTLKHNLYSAGIARNVTVGEVMDIRSGFVCAEYL